jgi:hypothetical protein
MDVVENTRLEVTLEPELPEGATLVSRYVNTINADANTDSITFANSNGKAEFLEFLDLLLEQCNKADEE